MIEADLRLADGRTLHYYDTGSDAGGPTVYWHHGTPNIGTPPKPLFAAAERLGIRWVSHDRPGYGGSTPRPDRDIASAATDAAAVADALGIARFAAMGHSGGGAHALACAALLPDRVFGVVAAAAPAPFDAPGLDWFAGMGNPGSLRAAAAGRAAKEEHAASDTGEVAFTDADFSALDGDWGWFGEVVRPAVAGGPAPLIDDDLAYVAPWGFDPATITVPVLLPHGADDRVIPAAHGEWLANRCPTAELRSYPGEGHISVLNRAESTLEWLASIV